jgi:hypothetical protein
VREAAGALIAAAREGRKVHPADLAERLNDPAARALVLELSVEDRELRDEDKDYEDIEAEFADCMVRLQERHKRKEEERLIKDIEEARRREGDESPEVRRLLEEKNALLRERRKTALSS